MKFFKLNVFSGLIIAGLLLTGCFDEINKVYDGPAVVEFAQYDQPGSTNNYVSTITFPADAVDKSVEVSYALQLIAPHFNTETSIGFVVADHQVNSEGETVQSTTAVEGDHYNIITPSNAAVFPANSSVSSIDIELLSSELNPGQSVQFILELIEGNQLEPAHNYRYFRVIVRKAS